LRFQIFKISKEKKIVPQWTILAADLDVIRSKLGSVTGKEQLIIHA